MTGRLAGVVFLLNLDASPEVPTYRRKHACWFLGRRWFQSLCSSSEGSLYIRVELCFDH